MIPKNKLWYTVLILQMETQSVFWLQCFNSHICNLKHLKVKGLITGLAYIWKSKNFKNVLKKCGFFYSALEYYRIVSKSVVDSSRDEVFML